MKVTPCRLFLTTVLTVAAGLLTIGSVVAASQVTCELDSNEIALGDSAQLTITVSGGDSDKVSPPAVPGLEFVAVGQSTQIQIINGATTSSTSVTYQVNPQHAGTFTIPALAQGAEPLTLKVRPTGAGNTPAGGNTPSSSNLPPPTSSGLSGDKIQMSEGGAAFVRLGLPKSGLYVGETVPVEIQVGLKPGLVASLNGLPTLNGDSFALNQLTSKPEQTNEEIEGTPYTVLTWRSNLTALKPGGFSLTVETPLTVRIQTKPQRLAHLPEGFSDDLFDDPFIQNFFGGTTEKQITVSSEPKALTVLPLPSEGQPSGFSGAVGKFEISSQLSTATSPVGDPLTLRLKVSGTGDFDRVKSSMLGGVNRWKTYKPSAKFAPSDSVGYSGEKNFEQAIIPMEPGSQTVPALTFSYFDPATHRYETKQTEPLNLEVTGATAKNPVPVQSSAATSNLNVSDESKSNELRPDEVETGKVVRTLRPLYFQPGFLTSQGAIILCFICVCIWFRRREQEANDPNEARKREADIAIKQHLTEMKSASSVHNAAQFFKAARAALQQKMAMRWHLAPAAITIAEINTHLNGDGAEICHLFTLADHAAYSGQKMSNADFEQWTETVNKELKQMEER